MGLLHDLAYFFRNFRVLGGLILAFSDVGLKVVKLEPWEHSLCVHILANTFPGSHTHSLLPAVAGDLPIEVFVLFLILGACE